MSKNTFERTLKQWAKEWEEEHLPADEGEKVSKVRRLINQAFFDLLFGPAAGDDDPDSDWYQYPGFSTATDQIKTALADVPSVLYIDDEVGSWSDKEPEEEKCEECEGDGEDKEGDLCEACHGRGSFEPPYQVWKVDHATLVSAIVGKELAEYIR